MNEFCTYRMPIRTRVKVTKVASRARENSRKPTFTLPAGWTMVWDSGTSRPAQGGDHRLVQQQDNGHVQTALDQIEGQEHGGQHGSDVPRLKLGMYSGVIR